MRKVKTEAKKQYNKVGMGLLFFCLIVVISQTIAITIYMNYTEVTSLTLGNIVEWLINSGTQYFIALPIFYLLLITCKKEEVEKNKLTIKEFFIYLIEGFGLMYIGNIIGNVLSFAFSFLMSGEVATNPVAMATTNDNIIIRILFVVILAPIFEEIIFRKIIIDRTSKYGEKIAIIFSALAFALFHMNLFQFFYAFGIGIIFGYVYVRTRDIKYTMIMHAIINLIGGFVSPTILTYLSSNILQFIEVPSINELLSYGVSVILLLIYSVVNYAVSIIGAVLFFTRLKKARFITKDDQIPRSKIFSTCYLNVFYILYFVICIAITVIQLI